MLSRTNLGLRWLASWLVDRLAGRLAGLLAMSLASAVLLAGPVQAGEGGGPQRAAALALAIDANDARVIVKFRSASALALDAAGQPRHAGRLGRQLALPLEDGHVLGRRTQSLRGRGLSSAALAARLAALPEVEWAVPVGRKTIRAVPPNDPFYADGQTNITPAAGQWYLRAPNSTLVSAINAVGAWDITEGSASITVAVLDTGVRFDHPDFVKSDLLSSKLWPGYDFVSRSSASNDGGGRDNDASDPGDWSVADECKLSTPGMASSWHGTQVAGLIGAATDNAVGMAGVGRNVMVLPVRVLGKCGGFDDDIIAGMRWAAGMSNTAACSAAGIAATRAENCNPRPARVLNLSLGSSGTCSAGYRDAVAELTTVGVVVVVASGNDAGRAVNEPANCPGAIAVSGVRHAGTKVGYSNLGPEVAVAAPAGNCVTLAAGACAYPLLTTINAGATAPATNTYSSGANATLGTSFAAPLVAGTVGLMLSVDPRLTPAQIKATLQATARAFPGVGAQDDTAVACRAPGSFDQIECYCTTSTCGAGLLDAGAAVAKVANVTTPPSAVMTISVPAPTVGAPMIFEGVSSSRSVMTTQWSVVEGGGIARLASSTTPTTTLTATGAGAVKVNLTVTDAAGSSSTTSRSFVAAAAPAASISLPIGPFMVGQNATLTGSATAFGGRAVASYQWSITLGAGLATFVGATNQSQVTLLPSVAGPVEVSLKVLDTAGGAQTVTASFRSVAVPLASIAVSNDAPEVGTSVTLDGTASTVDASRTIAGFQWVITSGGNLASLQNSGRAVATLTALAQGSVSLALTVTDSAGTSSTSTRTVSVTSQSVTITPPVGGGGAMGAEWLLGLALAVLALLRARPVRPRA